MKVVSQAFKDAFGRPAMRIKTKVHMELGNNRFNDEQIVSASSTKRMIGKIDYITFWHPEDVFNNKNRNAMQIAVCDQGARAVGKNNKGAYRVASVNNNLLDAKAERGWWSLLKSDPDSILGWNKMDYNSVNWGRPAVSGRTFYPASWPTNRSKYIWSDLASRRGSVWFRRYLKITASTSYTFYATADDAFQLYLDGQLILSGGDTYSTPRDPVTGSEATDLGFAQHISGPHGFAKTYKVTMNLSAGDHVVAAKGINYPIIGASRITGGNPGAFLFALLKDSDSSIILVSDNTWDCVGYLLGPAELTAQIKPGGSLPIGTYYYRVATINNNLETSPSATVKVKITQPNSKVQLRWNAEGNSYHVYRGTDQFIQNIYSIVTTNIYTDYGYMERSGSPVSGTFATPEWVKSLFLLRRINQIDIWTTEAYSNMSQITIQYLDSGDIWQTVTSGFNLANNIYHYEFPMAPVLCKGLRAYINKTYIGNQYARISELQGLFVVDVDSSNDIVSANINQQREEYANTVPIGMTRANTLDLVLQNVDQQYSTNVSTGQYYPYITANNILTAKLGIDTSNEPNGLGHKNAVLSLNPFAYWKIHGNIAEDITESELDGRCGSGLTVTQDSPLYDDADSSSFLFESIQNANVALPSFELHTPVSFVYWINYNGGNPIWFQAFGPSLPGGFGIGAYPDGTVSFWSGAYWYKGTIPANDNQWHQIGITLGINNRLTFYVDRNFDSTWGITRRNGPGKYSSGLYEDGTYGPVITLPLYEDGLYEDNTYSGLTPLPEYPKYLGTTQQANVTVGSKLSEFAIFNHELTHADMVFLYNAAKNSVFEYTPMGTFYSDSWNVSGDNLTASVQCRDFSKYLQDEKLFNLGKVWINATAGRVVHDLMAMVGFPPDQINVDSNSVRTFPIIFLKDKTIWLLFAELGFADQGLYGFDEDNIFFYDSLSAVDKPPHVKEGEL